MPSIFSFSHAFSLFLLLLRSLSIPTDALGDFDAPLLPPEVKGPKEKSPAVEKSESKSVAAAVEPSATTSSTSTAAAPKKAGGLGALPPRKQQQPAAKATAAEGFNSSKGKERASGFDFGAALASGGGGGGSGGAKPKNPSGAASKAAAAAAAASPAEPDGAAMLAALMSQLGNLRGEGNLGEGGGSSGKDATLAALAEQLSAAAAAAGKGEGGRDDKDDDEPLPEDLLSRLEATLDRLQAAGAEAAAGEEGEEENDGDGGDGTAAAGGGGKGTEALSGFAAIIMRQMLAKEVMYTPMREIGEKYPAWLEENSSKLTGEEIARYERQQACVSKIVSHYESDSADFDALFALLQEMQSQGQPPQELVDELAPGLTFGEDGMPNLFGGGGSGGGGGGLAGGLAGLAGLGLPGAGAGGNDACSLM